MTTFDDLYAAASLDAELSVFGESITFHPANGPARTLTAIVAMRSTQDNGLENEVAEVTVKRDESDATYGGISDPQEGDKFLRAGENQSDGFFAWNREIVEQSSVHQVLRFVRPKRFRIGKRS
jgi:hypothetical protein